MGVRMRVVRYLLVSGSAVVAAGSLALARIRAVLIRHVIAGFTVLRRGGIAAPRFARFMSGRIVWHWLAHQLVTHAALALASH